MSLIAIILIILGGIILLLVEFLVVPGVSVFGIGGFCASSWCYCILCISRKYGRTYNPDRSRRCVSTLHGVRIPAQNMEKMGLNASIGQQDRGPLNLINQPAAIPEEP